MNTTFEKSRTGLAWPGAMLAAAAAALLCVTGPAMAQDAAPEEAPATEAAPADAVDGGLPPLSTDLGAAPTFDPLTGDLAAPAPADNGMANDGFDAFGNPVGEEEDVSEEEAVNPYSFAHMWEAGDIVSRSTLIILILMSAASWYIIVTKAIDQTRISGQAKKLGAFWTAPTVEEGVSRLGAKNSYRPLAVAADVDNRARAEGIAGLIGVRRRAEIDLGRGVENINSRMQGGLAVLATVGSTAPFVGLLGTVWGIRNALIELGLSGEPSIERIAGPVGEALLMTAIGLIVAVPAVFLYNVLGRRNKKIMDVVKAFSTDLQALIVTKTSA